MTYKPRPYNLEDHEVFLGNSLFDLSEITERALDILILSERQLIVYLSRLRAASRALAEGLRLGGAGPIRQERRGPPEGRRAARHQPPA